MTEKTTHRLKRAHKSRTVMFNVGIVITSSVVTIIPNMALKPWHAIAALIGFGLVNLWLRFDTTDDLADK